MKFLSIKINEVPVLFKAVSDENIEMIKVLLSNEKINVNQLCI